MVLQHILHTYDICHLKSPILLTGETFLPKFDEAITLDICLCCKTCCLPFCNFIFIWFWLFAVVMSCHL